MPLRDALVSSKTIIQGSVINKSSGTRHSLDLRFFSADVSPNKHYMSLEDGVTYEPKKDRI